MTPTRGTVPWLIRALVDWTDTVGQGLALVVWKSARERDLAVSKLQARFREKNLRVEEVRGLRLTLPEFVQSIERSQADVLLVLEPEAVMFEGDDRALWRMNFFRESLVAFPGAQIWFMPEQAALRFGRDLPDLARFFLFRETLTVEDEPAEREGMPDVHETREIEPQGSARGSILLERALQAAEKGGSPAKIWTELGLPAIGAFLGARDLPGAESAVARIAEVSGSPEAALLQAESDGIAPDRQADGYITLGRLYGEQLKLDDSLRVTDKAVGIYRHLAADPLTFRPNLAQALNDLSVCQIDLGRWEDALLSIEEAVVIRRELATTNPDAFRPNLGTSLNNLSICQSNLGRREDALASIEESVRIYRELAKSNPAGFRPELAMVLNNLSNRQSSLGRREDASASIDEAVGIRRELAKSNPDSFRSALARSLNNLSLRQRHLGRLDDALASIEEAIGIYRDEVATRPALIPELARSLRVQSDALAELDRLPDSVAAAAESLRILAPFAQRYPDAYRSLGTATLHAYLARTKALAVDPDPDLLAAYAHLLPREP